MIQNNYIENRVGIWEIKDWVHCRLRKREKLKNKIVESPIDGQTGVGCLKRIKVLRLGEEEGSAL